MSSMLEEEKKEEVSLDELLKRFEEYANEPGLLDAFVLTYLEPYMLKSILATNADAMKKAEAIESFGDLMASYSALHTIYFWFAEFASQYPEEGHFKKDMEEIVRTMQEVAKRVIELYFEIKKARTLDVIIMDFRYLASKLQDKISLFAYHVLDYIAELRFSKQASSTP